MFLVILLTLGTALSSGWLLHFRGRLNMSVPAAILLAILHTLAGVASVKAFAFLESSGENTTGMSLYGGVFFMPVLYFVGAKLAKRDARTVFDVFVFPMITTLACARVNCIISGCCGGISFFGIQGIHWPTREFEIAFYIVLTSVLARKAHGDYVPGTLYPIYMMAYGVFRFFIEWVRISDGSVFFHPAHFWSAISLGIGLSVYIELNSSAKKAKVRKARR